MSKNYSLGLDIGTNSVGWAVVDENNKIVRKNGFSMWGVRMFDDAESASERRSFRSNRRRIARRKQRINLLQKEFENEITKVDSNFFQRLNDSFFKIEDKKLNNTYTLFDGEYTDKDYFKTYPTIYHLRQKLIKTDEKIDIRMLYLALHHIIKYRGNFLKEGEDFNKIDSTDLKYKFERINMVLDDYKANEEYEDDEQYFQSINIDADLNTLKEIINSNKTIKDKTNELLELFSVSKNSLVGELFIKLLLGSSVNISKLKYNKEQSKDKIEINFERENWEENLEKAKTEFHNFARIYDLIPLIKDISDSYYLDKILGNYGFISDYFVDMYNEHEKQLKEFKKLTKKYNLKKECFSAKNLNNYPKYIGMNSCGKKITRFSHCSIDEFYSFIETKILSKIEEQNPSEEDKSKIEKIRSLMNAHEFLCRQNSGHNTIIPMQLNLKELKLILEKQSKYYPFLNEIADGFTRKDRIIGIFRFIVPYYVGPLNNKSNYAWLTKNDGKENEKIYPWNFHEVINVDETAKEFIKRMQRKCTYLHGNNDYCLPKKSLLFSEFTCLQYLNKLKIDGQSISLELKNELYNEIFLKNKKPTRKAILSYLKTNHGYDLNSTENQSGLPEVTCNMSSYIVFKEIYGSEFESKYDEIEEIIKDITVFEDKKILEKRLKELYSLTDDKIKRIKSLDYKEYGNISRNLLNLTKTNKETGEVYGPIIQIMRETNLNLQQIIDGEEYYFREAIDEYNNNIGQEENLSFQDYIEENVYASPIMKRALIQAYTIIEEVEKILKQPISKFYVECSRHDDKNKRVPNSRYKKLSELYSECRKISKELEEYHIDIKSLKDSLDKHQDKLRSDKIYLYFTQLGKCMYTLEDINIEDVISGKFDIDHIYPQSLIKDDSLTNRVLVNKSFNEYKKKDSFLFEVNDFHLSKVKHFYDLLLEKGLINKDKYRRLIEKDISNDKLETFISRQLVTTDQAVIGLIDLLKNYKHVSSNDIIYSKATNISDFRHKYDIVKSRLANNYHHAHDAYLNVVVGRAINEYYKAHFILSKNYDYSAIRNSKHTINPERILEKDRYFKNRVIWKKDETIKLIKKYIYERYDIHETLRTFNSSKMFNKTTVLPASQSDKLVPIKRNLPTNKYGGGTSNSYHHYALIKNVNSKNKVSYILEPIPFTYKNNINEYLKNVYDNFEVVVDSIKSNVIIEMPYNENSIKAYITGVSGNMFLLKNKIDRNFNEKAIQIIKKVEKYKNNLTNKIKMDTTKDGLCLANNMYLTYDDCNYLLNDGIIPLFDKPIYSYSVISKINKSLKAFNINSLGIFEYANLLSELLELLKTNERKVSNLTRIGLKESSGTLCLNHVLKPGMKLLAESVTGYYSKVIFEVPNGI